MPEYIEREAAIKFVKEQMEETNNKTAINGSFVTQTYAMATRHAVALLRYVPTAYPKADVVEVRHGKWIRPNVPNTRSYKWQCSECGQIAYWLHYGNRGSKNIICKFGYCPHCGARMDGDTK